MSYYSTLTDKKFYWEYSVNGDFKDLIIDDTLKTPVNYVRLTHYVDAKLIHDQLTDSSVTGILILVKKKQ